MIKRPYRTCTFFFTRGCFYSAYTAVIGTCLRLCLKAKVMPKSCWSDLISSTNKSSLAKRQFSKMETKKHVFLHSFQVQLVGVNGCSTLSTHTLSAVYLILVLGLQLIPYKVAEYSSTTQP